MMDRAVGPWWLLRMVSWGDAPGWDEIAEFTDYKGFTGLTQLRPGKRANP
jgi:hypothetical protein